MSIRIEDLKTRFQKTERMPVVFLGHGNPMHALGNNPYADAWQHLGQSLPRPKAILLVSAHWMSRGSLLVDVSTMPRTIHDFRGFPPALYEQQYPAPGHPKLAREVVALLSSHHAEEDETWGLDHGSWAVLKWLYPEADVPVFQLSIDMSRPLAWHLEVGAQLAELRDRGILILGSGNLVHNLRNLRFDGAPFDWAEGFDQFVANKLTDRNFDALADRRAMGPLFEQAHPSFDHYLPALTVAGTVQRDDELAFMNDSIDAGSISMRSFIFS
ncbi:Aromatic ring-opening dioxygenase, catalytic subunit, LigB family [Cognatishimia maritima]|uniref:Aromatic ring-opening dioxygenase, catalytic subunit, LigB family n=2 Tax=Cognatishimia maritima TaxID=870908 RepID=A0A1M5V2I2_9RHOB|nr:Aromatic ring-opening dioxygenase, catalytic subunit, LigB family [Cognatishimia maritima]